MRTRAWRILGTAAVLTVAGAGHAAAVVPDSPDDLPSPTADQLTRSVQQWDPSGAVHQWDPSGAVDSFEDVDTADGETTITLATDILFASQSDELPDSAAQRIPELLDDVTEGASVQVHGHTDSLVGPIPNDELSQNRAQAVADVIGDDRPDLTLDVEGFADTQPAQDEDPDDASTFAANRRVEIIYTD